jgi:hypothetical protein
LQKYVFPSVHHTLFELYLYIKTASHVILENLTAGAMVGTLAKMVIAPLDKTKIIFQVKIKTGG